MEYGILLKGNYLRVKGTLSLMSHPGSDIGAINPTEQNRTENIIIFVKFRKFGKISYLGIIQIYCQIKIVFLSIKIRFNKKTGDI